MSFVNSVLFTAEKNTIFDVKNRIPSLQAEVNEYKTSIDKYLQNIHAYHLIEPKRNVQLDKLHSLLNEVNNMNNQVEEIFARNFSTIDVELFELRDNVAAADFSIKQVNTVMEMHESLKKIEKDLTRRNYIEAVEELHKLTIHSQTVSKTSQLICAQPLLEKTNRIDTEVVFTLTDLVSEAILFNSSTQDTNVISTITIVDSHCNLQDIFKACYMYSIRANIDIDYLNTFVSFLWNEIITPTICHQSKLELTSTCIKTIYNPHGTERDSYKHIFDKLVQLFEKLNDLLNYNLDDECTVIQYIGADVRDNLSELLIKSCLVHTIPTTAEGLSLYSQVITDTEVFHKRLVDLNIFSVDTRAIIEHANNVDVHFINNKCDGYMTDALNIMKEDLHDVIEVGGMEQSVDFQKCCVSKSVVKLLELGEKIIDWATKTSEVSAKRLLSTAQKMFYGYPSYIMLNHSALLDTIPQQVAIFYNNCMYLAHALSNLNKYVSKLQHENKSVDFEQFSSICKTLIDSGKAALDNCIKEQIKLATGTLEAADLDALKTNDNINFENIEKSIRHCLRQQELLKTVWQKILPTTIYNNALGGILDASCNIILVAILSAEDINATNAEHLVDVLKLVLTRGPKLFLPNTNLSEIVPRWNKLSGLVFILHASMIDICEKWTSRSKSDLLADFKATEIRQLIKAIFQNSERRATILTKIQD